MLVGDEQHLRRVCFQSGPHPEHVAKMWRRAQAPFSLVIEQLQQYFAGTRRQFELPLAPQGSEFQLRVWKLLQAIPYGQTVSYGDLARQLGNASASRAVGLANGANPLPIVIPCHRVIGADGSLTGFGGGLPIKRALLELEQADCVQDLFTRAG